MGTLQRLASHPRREIRRAAVLALGCLGDYESNATLGAALLDEDRTVRILAENSIRQVWTRAAGDKDRIQLDTIIRLNAARQFDKVVRMASDLIKRVPAFAEAWNQRAYAHHALGHYRRIGPRLPRGVGDQPLSLHCRRGHGALKARLEQFGPVVANEFTPKCSLEPYELTVFPDGRVIVKGTRDPAVARGLYARYIGA